MVFKNLFKKKSKQDSKDMPEIPQGLDMPPPVMPIEKHEMADIPVPPTGIDSGDIPDLPPFPPLTPHDSPPEHPLGKMPPKMPMHEEDHDLPPMPDVPPPMHEDKHPPEEHEVKLPEDKHEGHDMEEHDMPPILPHKPMQHPEPKKEESKHEEKAPERIMDTTNPLFVVVQDYAHALDTIAAAKYNVKECEDALSKISDLNKQELSQLSLWKSDFDTSLKGFSQVDNILFKRYRR